MSARPSILLGGVLGGVVVTVLCLNLKYGLPKRCGEGFTTEDAEDTEGELRGSLRMAVNFYCSSDFDSANTVDSPCPGSVVLRSV